MIGFIVWLLLSMLICFTFLYRNRKDISDDDDLSIVTLCVFFLWPLIGIALIIVSPVFILTWAVKRLP